MNSTPTKRWCSHCGTNRHVDLIRTTTVDYPDGKAVVSEWRCAECGEITEFRAYVDPSGQPSFNASLRRMQI